MLIRKVRTFVRIIFSSLVTVTGVKNAKFMTVDETINDVCKKNKSIIRVGDGEMNILRGEGVSYQKWSPELQAGMEDVLKKYFRNTDVYLLCMPGQFLTPRSYELEWKHLMSWAFSRKLFSEKYDVEITYGDAFLFAKGNESKYEKIWTSTNIDEIIFVHNNIKYACQFEHKYGIKTKFVQIPNENVFSLKDDIERKILDLAGENSMVLISAGPAAKIMVMDLSERGIWCIDTGHCWDSPLLLR